jgi:hypothetical protein
MFLASAACIGLPDSRDVAEGISTDSAKGRNFLRRGSLVTIRDEPRRVMGVLSENWRDV